MRIDNAANLNKYEVTAVTAVYAIHTLLTNYAHGYTVIDYTYYNARDYKNRNQ